MSSAFDRICANIAEEHTDPRALTRRVIDGIRELVPTDRVTFWELRDNGTELATLHGSGLTSTLAIPVGHGFAGICARDGSDIIVSDAYTDSRFNSASDMATRYRTRSVCCLPIFRNGTLIAVVQALNRLRPEEEGGKKIWIPCEEAWFSVGDFSKEDVCQLRKVANLAGVALENIQRLATLRRLFANLGFALSQLISHRDGITGEHTQFVAHVAAALARRLGLSSEDVLVLETAAALHDVGKIGIPDPILNKTGKFDEVEWGVMRTHAPIGHAVLSAIAWPPELASVPRLVRDHHERLDGTGYPNRRSGNELCLLTRILSVADVFGAMVQRRPYKEALSFEEALAHCRKLTCAPTLWFDSTIVDALAALLMRGEISDPTLAR
jgi:putative nucleotidyltransferase with HDIG domain